MDRLRAWRSEAMVGAWAEGKGAVRTLLPPAEGPYGIGWSPGAVWSKGLVGVARYGAASDDDLGTPDVVVVGQAFDGRSGLSTALEAMHGAHLRWGAEASRIRFVRLLQVGCDPALVEIASQFGIDTEFIDGDSSAERLSEDALVDLYRETLPVSSGSWKEVKVGRRRIDLVVVEGSGQVIEQTHAFQALGPLEAVLQEADAVTVIEAKKRLDGDVIGQAVAGARQLASSLGIALDRCKPVVLVGSVDAHERMAVAERYGVEVVLAPLPEVG